MSDAKYVQGAQNTESAREDIEASKSKTISHQGNKPRGKSNTVLIAVVIVVALGLALGLSLGLGLKDDDKSGVPTLDYNYKQLGADWTGVCSTGTQQSPINLRAADIGTNANVAVAFDINQNNVDGVKVKNTGGTLKAETDPSDIRSTLLTGTQLKFGALQFHFHAPAEHALEGVIHDLELHIVHQDDKTLSSGHTEQRTFAVLGIFFELDNSNNATPNPLIEALKVDQLGSDLSVNFQTVLGQYLAASTPMYHYEGSLTTPPCTEAVNWYLIRNPLKITPAQLSEFTKLWAGSSAFGGGNGNNRALQNLNGRKIYSVNRGT